MLNRIFTILLIALGLILITSCSNFDQGQIQNVGMLVDSSIDDKAWGEKGYDGLVTIGEEFDVDIFYKENVTTEQDTRNAVDELVQDGVNLIFGHSNIYGKYFVDIADDYPDVHFVYFNGGYFDDNVTSLNFNAHAMGFFGGMVAGEMTKTDQVAIIAAYEWQPELEGFFEGVNYQNPSANVRMNFINDWNDTQTATEIYEKMRDSGVDVFYPTGDAFSSNIIKSAQEDGLYAIGYVSDQSNLGEETVLTSTVQHVDKLYELAAEKFNEDALDGTIMAFDFQEEVISLGEYSPKVPESYEEFMNETIEEYMETGLLPNEQ